MIRCEEMQKEGGLIDKYVEQELTEEEKLSPEELVQVEEHFKICDECFNVYSDHYRNEADWKDAERYARIALFSR